MRSSLHRWFVRPSAVVAIASMCFVGASTFAQTATETRVDVSTENGKVMFINHVKISAEVEGKLVELAIEEGASVEEGSVVGIVDDTAAKLALELKRAEEEEARWRPPMSHP